MSQPVRVAEPMPPGKDARKRGQPSNPSWPTRRWTDVNDRPGIHVRGNPVQERWREEPPSPLDNLTASGESRGVETFRVFTGIMNDGEKPDDIRGLAMTEWEVRAADFEALDVGPAKRRTRPGRARWCILLAPFT